MKRHKAENDSEGYVNDVLQVELVCVSRTSNLTAPRSTTQRRPGSSVHCFIPVFSIHYVNPSTVRDNDLTKVVA